MTKLETLRQAMRSNDWRGAIAIAARFPRLGIHRNAILDAQLAITRPDFVRQVRRNPDDLIAAGIAALRLAYGG